MQSFAALLPSLVLLSFSGISSVYAHHYQVFRDPAHNLDSLAASLHSVLAFNGHPGRHQIPRFETAQVQSIALFNELMEDHEFQSAFLNTDIHQRSYINLGRKQPFVQLGHMNVPVAATVALPIVPNRIKDGPGEKTFLVFSAGPSTKKDEVNVLLHGYLKVSNAPGIEHALPTNFEISRPGSSKIKLPRPNKSKPKLSFEVGHVLSRAELAEYAYKF
ncbi:uncharacterized protein MEPE_06095 [Melanopsichium pennsylvanicum]|uniref:Uncharacterized protein n=1 Tax=Melanopsichium pennsylvanicum TaxID=63383 RepID=A0AAJ4XRW8_9BASI|nr:uncharacterized protein MEPE_06095 [Melanopsichium pennsylvanicum]